MTTWFERLMGFREESPEQVRRQIAVDSHTLVSAENGRRVGCGRLAIPSLAEIRRTASGSDHTEPPTVSEVVADVAALHRDPDNAGALFQAASQFNLLEMAGPHVTPEEGVGIYEYDRTQGPACAIALMALYFISMPLLIFVMIWWAVAIKRYLRMPHGCAVALLLGVLAVLLPTLPFGVASLFF